MSMERKVPEIYETPHFRKGNSNSHISNDKLLEKFPENYKTCRFILLDTETTGLKLEKDRLISINAVEMINGELTGIQFNAYLNRRFNEHSLPLMYYLSDYNYSRKDNVRKSLETFLDFVSDSIVITHNALFDMKFINAELKKYGLRQIPLGQCLCTLRILRNLKKVGKIDKNFRLRLCDLCKYYGIYVDPKDLHQGIVDTIVFGRCVAKMIEDGIYNDYNNYDYEETNSFFNYSQDDLNCNFDDSSDELTREDYLEEDVKDNENEDINISINFNKPIISKSQEKKRKNDNINKSFNKKYHKKNYNKLYEPLKENQNDNFIFKPFKEKNINNFYENENYYEKENFYENKNSRGNCIYNNHKNRNKISFKNKNNDNKRKVGKENHYNERINKNAFNNSIVIPKENVDFKKYKSNNIEFSDVNQNKNIENPKEKTKIKFLKNAFKSYIKDNQQKILEKSILNNTII